jgi:hypothetical protein
MSNKTRAAPYESRRWVEKHVDWPEKKECLIFPYGRITNGYGQVYDERYQYKQIYAHRLMCELVHGPAPSDNYEAAHSCGNGHLGCVNPNHLRWDTPSGNAADKFEHGTLLYGEKHPSRIKTLQEAKEIYRRAWEGEPTIKLAKEFGISPANVSMIKHGHSWKIDIGDNDNDTYKSPEATRLNNAGIKHLSESDVHLIRSMIHDGIPMKEIAEMLRISYGRVTAIKRGEYYSKVA